jgi:hypothetical protein|tara:strand:- start:48 stop:800 length:753 start_codon:yes stop_codon:yes gene_type:complete
LVIKKNSTGLLITLSFLLILPFVQKQWFNLYLFNINDFSFYSVLYYLSGTIGPLLICFNSLNNNTHYKFNNKNTYIKNSIKGKSLFFLVAINLIFLSYFTINYININFDLISNLFIEGFDFQQLDIFQLSSLILLISILLIFKKSRLLYKKIILGNFILISFYIWYLQINNIIVDDNFNIHRYFGLNNLNVVNVLILVAIEISYYSWSFLSYKTNLSDWVVRKPQKGDLIPFLNMIIFYFFIIIYYLILN